MITVENGFIALTVLMTILLILIGFYVIKTTFLETKKKKVILLSGLVLWLMYIFAIGKTDFLTNFDFPPRFVLFLIVPAFLFIGIFLFKNRKSKWIQNIPTSWLIFYQSFRIVIESLFVLAVAKGFLHKEVTFEGYNYDIVFAFSALILGVLFLKNYISRRILLYWNYLGVLVIGVIIFLFITSVYFPQIYGSNVALLPKEFGTFPFVLVPGFLMPSAVFIHILSIIQIKNK